MAKIPKHDHKPRIISHYPDFSRVLMMCEICPETKVITPAKVRIPKGKVTRGAKMSEFLPRLLRYEHLCCDTPIPDPPEDD